MSQAVLGYNHSPAYVRDVLVRARAYAGDEQLATTIGEPTNATACGELAVATGPANLRDAERVTAPRSFRALPPWARAAPNEPAAIDARLYNDVAIEFVGYDGYPSHGSPRTCTGPCRAHLHLSWASPCYGTSQLSAPCREVTAFPAP